MAHREPNGSLPGLLEAACWIGNEQPRLETNLVDDLTLAWVSQSRT
jgi:hypothetical protein